MKKPYDKPNIVLFSLETADDFCAVSDKTDIGGNFNDYGNTSSEDDGI